MSQTMKLSEAIRLGAMLRSQAFNAYANEHGTCALGATAEAVSGRMPSKSTLENLSDTVPMWRDFLYRKAKCPLHCGAPDGDPFPIESIIAHLNDYHFWTRERIADWVESIENTMGQPAHCATEAPAALEEVTA